MDEFTQLQKDATQMHAALHKLIAVACTCKKRNTPEWMKYFAECINAAIQECGSNDRVKWPGDWSNEFHFELGG